MKTALYFCNCGANIADKIDWEQVKGKISNAPSGEFVFRTVDFLCSEDGKETLSKDLKENKADCVVIAACSPRDHENTFMRVLAGAGVNPYLMQMVNVREQVAWVTEDGTKATAKACRYIKAAVKRVALHDPLEKKELDVCQDVLVIGAGPAGLKAALSIAGSGRKVVVIEKAPVIGGMPVRFEELFPDMECGSCMLEPLLGEILHGEHAENIELLTLAEVVEVTGCYGNFVVKIRQRPRYVDVHKCVGCAECIEPCPVSAKNDFNCGLSERKAISFPFAGALPNAPYIDPGVCLRNKQEDCSLCKDACPMEGAVVYDDSEKIVERRAGAVIVAVGSGTYDCKKIPNLAYGKMPDIFTGPEFERMLASNGPSGGELRTSSGTPPLSVAIVHCVGSLDVKHMEYCSGICCQYAFKFNHIIGKKMPGTKIYHLFRELSLPGKDAFALYNDARADPGSTFIRYGDIADLKVQETNGGKSISFRDTAGADRAVSADMIILCPAVVPADDCGELGAILDAARDRFGFFEELHGRMDSAQSKIKGVFIAGTCQSPMDIQKSVNQAMAAAGYIMSGLAAGKKLEINPVNALIDSERCSGCRLCVKVCPYKAISFDEEKGVCAVNDVLCRGCGTCVAACPSGVVTGRHFTTEQILQEIEGVLG